MRILLIFILGLLLSACSQEQLVHHQGYVFGTLVDISIEGEKEAKAEAAIQHVMQDFQTLHNRLHAWQMGSEITAINIAFAKGDTPIEIKPDVKDMLLYATTLSNQSNGLFNPAIGKLIQLWGFQRDEFTPVQINPQAIHTLVQSNPSMNDIVIHENTAYSKNRNVQLDLGGYAKGYALDRAATYLRSQGIHNALINIGGNIIAIGQHGKHPWRVGIQHPRQAGPIATLDLPDGWAIGTSGDYQRYFELNGQRYCHIIDPRTGYPARGTQAVTILIPPSEHAGVLSDANSKPIFIADPRDVPSTIKHMGLQDVMVINQQGQISVTSALAKRITWTRPNVDFQTLQ